MSLETKKIFRNVALLGRYSIDHRLRKRKEVSEAHNFPHIRNVADLTQSVADLYGYTDREKLLCFTSGIFHDLIRHPTEDPQVKDDEASAYEAKRILNNAVTRGIPTTETERDAIVFAISNHGRYPDWLNDPRTRNRPPQSLEEKLWLALFAADKMEANGVRVIARRSSFVAGDRLRGEQGDWKTFGFKPDQDEALVVAIESFLRLSFINPEGVYPEILQPLMHPLYEKQREFVLGLMKGMNLTLSDIAALMINRKNTEGENILQVRKLGVFNSVTELTEALRLKSGITDTTIANVTSEQAESALETVLYFSRRYRDNLDAVVLKWQSEGEMAQKWRAEMIDYNEGKWLNRLKEQIYLLRLTREHTLHDESLMPLELGPAVRTPDYGYPNWGLEPLDEEVVTRLYAAEWGGGTPDQLALVSQASIEAGFGDFPESLRKKTADIVAAILKEYLVSDELTILDIGCGPGLSTLEIYNALPEPLKHLTKFILLDPSAASLQAAEKLMQEHGVRYQTIHDVDLHIGKYLVPGSVDILTGVASIHHHARIPFDIYHQMLKPGGYAIFADWHNSIWEHPYRVLQMLRQFDWPNKGKALAHWVETYPSAGIPLPEPTNPPDAQANKDIMNYWLAYFRLLRKNGDGFGTNAIWPHEGHRSVERYVEAMQLVGFSLNSDTVNRLIKERVLACNPHQILPVSRLLMVTVGQKV